MPHARETGGYEVKRVVQLGAALLLTASIGCGEQPDDTQPEPLVEQEEQEPVRPQVVPIESIPMPEPPEPRRRFLVARSAGPEDLSGAWEARAAICEDLGVLQVLAEIPGFGTLLLFQLPPAGDRVGVYPISHAETGAPDPPASQIGVSSSAMATPSRTRATTVRSNSLRLTSA